MTMKLVVYHPDGNTNEMCFSDVDKLLEKARFSIGNGIRVSIMFDSIEEVDQLRAGESDGWVSPEAIGNMIASLECWAKECDRNLQNAPTEAAAREWIERNRTHNAIIRYLKDLRDG